VSAPAAESSTIDQSPATTAPPPGKLAYWKLAAVLFVTFLILDHATKLWSIDRLKHIGPGPEPVIHVIQGFLALRYDENTGAAFSILEGRTTLLGFVSLVAVFGLCGYFWMLPAREPWGRAALALILSGAVGNMIDRFYRGYVVDFILAYWRNYYWPTFNVADTCICVGAGILAFRFAKGKI
jgi:signal peptidase II